MNFGIETTEENWAKWLIYAWPESDEIAACFLACMCQRAKADAEYKPSVKTEKIYIDTIYDLKIIAYGLETEVSLRQTKYN